jgi:hypothetical protein
MTRLQRKIEEVEEEEEEEKEEEEKIQRKVGDGKLQGR